LVVDASDKEAGLVAEQKRRRNLKGGRKTKRDRNFGIFDAAFWRWWHRIGKRRHGGLDLASQEAQSVYDEWIRDGKPSAK